MVVGTGFEDKICWIHDEHRNMMYGDKPYSYHLKSVVNILIRTKFYKSLPEKEKAIYRAVAISHDMIEDCVSYMGFMGICRNYFNQDDSLMIAEAVYALTEEKGRTRKERQGESYKNGVAENRVARVVKLCDIRANALHSMYFLDSKYAMYKKEWADWRLLLSGRIGTDELITENDKTFDIKK